MEELLEGGWGEDHVLAVVCVGVYVAGVIVIAIGIVVDDAIMVLENIVQLHPIQH